MASLVRRYSALLRVHVRHTEARVKEMDRKSALKRKQLEVGFGNRQGLEIDASHVVLHSYFISLSFHLGGVRCLGFSLIM